MNEERDPLLESLFARAAPDQELVDERFTDQVMAGISRRGRNVLLGRAAIVAAIVVFELLLSAPLQNSVGTLTGLLGTTLIQLENEWLAMAVAPVNSIAGLVGITLLGLHALYRKIMR